MRPPKLRYLLFSLLAILRQRRAKYIMYKRDSGIAMNFSRSKGFASSSFYVFRALFLMAWAVQKAPIANFRCAFYEPKMVSSERQQHVGGERYRSRKYS